MVLLIFFLVLFEIYSCTTFYNTFLVENGQTDLVDFDVRVLFEKSKLTNLNSSVELSQYFRFKTKEGEFLNFFLESSSEDFLSFWVRVPEVKAYKDTEFLITYGNCIDESTSNTDLTSQWKEINLYTFSSDSCGSEEENQPWEETSEFNGFFLLFHDTFYQEIEEGPTFLHDYYHTHYLKDFEIGYSEYDTIESAQYEQYSWTTCYYNHTHLGVESFRIEMNRGIPEYSTMKLCKKEMNSVQRNVNLGKDTVVFFEDSDAFTNSINYVTLGDSDLIEKFLMVGEIYNSTAGGNKYHSHPISDVYLINETSYKEEQFALSKDDYRITTGFKNYASSSHQHRVEGIELEEVENDPPHIELILGKSSGSTIEINGDFMVMANTVPPLGYELVSTEDSDYYKRYVKISETAGTIGGSAIHSHDLISGGRSEQFNFTLDTGDFQISKGSDQYLYPFNKGSHTHTVSASLSDGFSYIKSKTIKLIKMKSQDKFRLTCIDCDHSIISKANVNHAYFSIFIVICLFLFW